MSGGISREYIKAQLDKELEAGAREHLSGEITLRLELNQGAPARARIQVERGLKPPPEPERGKDFRMG